VARTVWKSGRNGRLRPPSTGSMFTCPSPTDVALWAKKAVAASAGPVSLRGAVMVFDIALELVTLQQEPSWQRGDRNAWTLVERDGFRLVLAALKMGARLRPHRIRGWVSINVINGLLRVRTTVRGLVVAAGHIVVLEPNESHAVLSGII
jgi:quercetin dioxygenase-like cupin family protein